MTMFSDLNIYYLNQMGITPWITKENSVSSLNTIAAKKQESVKLVVLVPSNLCPKAQSLVTRIMACINLEHHEILMLDIEIDDVKLGSSQGWYAQLEHQTPLAILNLSVKTDLLLNCFECPVLTSLNPRDLLINPADKKKTLKDLHAINKLLALS